MVSVPHLRPADEYPRAVWRVIIHHVADGAANMAIDEAIAEHVASRLVPPTLRFYAWEPPCLSLGYAQPTAEVDFERLRRLGWDVVRRPTGGRAILHTDELTYSVAVPADDPRVAGGVVESYRRLAEGLLAGLNVLGAAVRADPAAENMDDPSSKGPVCFEVPSAYEITVEGRKLIGSAQTRRGGNVILQHGTLPLSGDLGRICDVLVFRDEESRTEARRRVLARAITLEEALRRPVDMAEVIAALMHGFRTALNLELVESSLTPSELSRAADLRASRYASQAWTQRY